MAGGPPRPARRCKQAPDVGTRTSSSAAPDVGTRAPSSGGEQVGGEALEPALACRRGGPAPRRPPRRGCTRVRPYADAPTSRSREHAEHLPQALGEVLGVFHLRRHQALHEPARVGGHHLSFPSAIPWHTGTRAPKPREGLGRGRRCGRGWAPTVSHRRGTRAVSLWCSALALSLWPLAAAPCPCVCGVCLGVVRWYG